MDIPIRLTCEGKLKISNQEEDVDQGVTIVGCLVLVMWIYHSEAYPLANQLVLCVEIMRGSPQIQISIEHGSLRKHCENTWNHLDKTKCLIEVIDT